MMTIALLAGIWSTTCIQTQISNLGQGHVKETYTISVDHSYEFKREWFRDAKCTEPQGTDIESGTIELGKEIQSVFVLSGTYEANFSSQGGVDLGAVAIQKNALKISRGIKNSSMRNTMLSLFEYVKHK